MQPYFTLCVGAAASGTVYDDMSLLSRVVIDMTHVPAVRVGVFVGKPMLIILLGVGVDSYEAFWPEGAWATWYVDDLFNTHTYEITDERDDLANHSLFFWTAVATVASDLGSCFDLRFRTGILLGLQPPIQDFASTLASELGFGCDFV